MAVAARGQERSAGESAGDCGNVVEFEVVPLSGLLPGTYRARRINDAGQVAGLLFPDTLFVWQAGVLDTIQFPGLVVWPTAITENGLVLSVLHEPLNDTNTAVQWQPATGEYHVIEPPVNIWPYDHTDGGLLVGLGNDDLESFAFDVKTGTYTPLLLGDPPPVPVGSTGAMAVNDSGLVVGSEVILEPNPNQPKNPAWFPKPFVWSAATGMSVLPVDPLGNAGRAVDINSRGDIVGHWFDVDFAHRPALWPAGGIELVDLGWPVNYFVAESTAINDVGQVLIEASNDLLMFTRGFVWEGGVYRDLTERVPCKPALEVWSAEDINNCGEILVGTKPPNTGPLYPLRWVILKPIVQPCPGDLNGDGAVGINDFLDLLAAWGPCDDPGNCAADLDGDGTVGILDMLGLLANWGPCT